MALAHSLTLMSTLLPTPSNPASTRFPILPFKSIKFPLRCLPPKPSLLTAEQQRHILEAVAESNEKLLPAVRTYENDLTRLTLVGAVDFQQALTAAAADGGRAADQHIAEGVPAMVVETLFPGPSDDHSTSSTRLFLPARKVKERAKSLKDSLSRDMLSSNNILAMTFRQVVLQQLWSFELRVFRPGTRRDMEDLENAREVPASFIISSSDERVISVLAEVLCLSALVSVEKQFFGHSPGRWSIKFLPLFRKLKRIISQDTSVVLDQLLEHEIIANAKSLLDKFSSEREKYKSMQMASENSWWKMSPFSELEKIGGPEFTAWISEYIPSYRLHINAGTFENMKFEGGDLSAANIWEILLTHSQMVSLANVLDMYYEDAFTLPNKQLSCGAVMKPSNLSKNKGSSSLLRMLSGILASGLFLFTISILGRLLMPSLPSWRKYHRENLLPQTSSISCVQPQSLEPDKLEVFCLYVISRIKDSFDWPGEIGKENGNCAWIGEVPLYLRRMADFDSSSLDVSSSLIPNESFEEIKESAQDIASYQVLLSTDGKIVGFQPTSRVAVNHWASNPLAKELYGRKKLAPGLVEPGLRISYPSDVVALELLMSVNPESRFAMVRPVDIARSSC